MKEVGCEVKAVVQFVSLMPDSPLLFSWKLLAFLESLKTCWYFKVIIEPIMLA